MKFNTYLQVLFICLSLIYSNRLKINSFNNLEINTNNNIKSDSKSTLNTENNRKTHRTEKILNQYGTNIKDLQNFMNTNFLEVRNNSIKSN